ncbi:MAG: GNAT family N-acetyltransferase [Sulfurovum sp.]|uniref:GNAT family N-acetyltransferase n=1 Tax=Sulfurovum sp. TaxID=1969726 RepID=UPI00286836D6|nr:GNAT family N-acetyltransferase [Sulfurovum sp.]MCO4844401.1 GNAT family N-acetyltransferase [Sulfurovum sp.]
MHIEPVSDTSKIKAIEEIAYEIWYEHYTPIIGKNQVEYMLEKFQSVKAMTEEIQNGFLYFLCEYDNKTIGYMSVNISDGVLFLSKLYVLSAERGKGHGRKMISYLGTLAKEKSLNKISLTVNKHNTGSINMYKKVGFIICGTAVKDIGNGFVMDDYQMEKSV